jgi:uncharacterized protein (TIGR02246 family)
MRLLSRVLAGCFLLVTISSFAAGSGVSAVDVEWIKAMKSGDAAAAAKCYSKDAVLWVAGAPVAKGAEEIRAAYEGLFSHYVIKDASLTEIGSETIGNRSIAWGTYQMGIVPKAGGLAVSTTGRYTVVAQRQHGGWVYTVDHASDDPSQSPVKQ